MSSFICIGCLIIVGLCTIVCASGRDGCSFDRRFLHRLEYSYLKVPEMNITLKHTGFLTCVLAAKLDRDRCGSVIKGNVLADTRGWEDRALFHICPSCEALLHSTCGLCLVRIVILARKFLS